MNQLTPREAYASYMLGTVLVDLRDPKEVENKTLDVKQQVFLPFEELESRFHELPANKPLVLVSRVGVKSKQAAQFLLNNGFSEVAFLQGGLAAWEQDGLPVK